MSAVGKLLTDANLFVGILLLFSPTFLSQAQNLTSVRQIQSISAQDSITIYRQLNEIYNQFKTTEDENQFAQLFHDSLETFIREDFHASSVLFKENIRPEEYFR